MEFKDYYATLGISRNAGAEEVKRAYRKLARKYHPDVSKEADAEAKFKELGEAYEVLKDPEKRKAYDQFGKDWKAGQEFRPPPGWDRDFDFGRGGGARPGTGPEGFSDFFEALFGGMGGMGREAGGGFSFRQRGAMRGEDHHARVMIRLEDAYEGTSRTIGLRVPELHPDGRVTNARLSACFFLASTAEVISPDRGAHYRRQNRSQSHCPRRPATARSTTALRTAAAGHPR